MQHDTLSQIKAFQSQKAFGDSQIFAAGRFYKRKMKQDLKSVCSDELKRNMNFSSFLAQWGS